MNKPNINLHYKEQDGMLLPDLTNFQQQRGGQALAGTADGAGISQGQPAGAIYDFENGWQSDGGHAPVQNEATEKIEALTQQMLQQEPMPQTEDILERTRHLNDLKLMAEETVLQTIVLIPR